LKTHLRIERESINPTRFINAKHQIDVLQRCSSLSFEQVIYRGNDHESVILLIEEE